MAIGWKMNSPLLTAPKFAFQTCLVIFVFVMAHIISIAAEAPGSHRLKRESDGVTGTPVNSSTAKNMTLGNVDDDTDEDNTGAVVAAVVIGLLVCVIIVIIVFVIKKRRKSRMMDKEKKMQIQMSSARNAGVYQDLTVSVPVDEKPPASPEHERLKTAEDA